MAWPVFTSDSISFQSSSGVPDDRDQHIQAQAAPGRRGRGRQPARRPSACPQPVMLVGAVRHAAGPLQVESACDQGAFEEACQAYRGDFLAGFSLGDCPEFDDWAFYRREALRGRLLHGLVPNYRAQARC